MFSYNDYVNLVKETQNAFFSKINMTGEFSEGLGDVIQFVGTTVKHRTDAYKLPRMQGVAGLLVAISVHQEEFLEDIGFWNSVATNAAIIDKATKLAMTEGEWNDVLNIAEVVMSLRFHEDPEKFIKKHGGKW